MSKVQEVRVYISRDEKSGKLVKNRLEKIRKYWAKNHGEPITASKVVLQLIDEEYRRLKQHGVIR